MKRKKTTILGINLDDKRTAASIRIAGYAIMLLAAAVIAGVLVATARGYDINRETGEVIQNGLILVDSDPVSAEISVDNEDEQDTTPGRLPLPSGQHTVLLERDGYFSWSKTIELVGSDVEWLYYPRLFPEEISITLLQDYESMFDAKQSPDKRWLLLQQDKSQPIFILIDLENVLDKPVVLRLPTDVLLDAEDDEAVSFEILQWAGTNRHFSVKQKVAGKQSIMVVDITDTAKTINVSRLAVLDIDEIFFKGNRADRMYISVQDAVREIELASGVVSPPLVRDVTQFIPNSNDALLFVRKTSSSARLQVGIWKNNEVTVVSSVTPGEKDFTLLYDTYDNHSYFVVGSDKSDSVEVFRDIERFEEDEIVPYATLNLATNLQSLTLSPNRQFILAQSGSEHISYDLEDDVELQFMTDEVFSANSNLQWIDSHRFVATDTKGMFVSHEYDGANKVVIGSTDRPNFPVFFDRAIEQMYVLNKAQSSEKIILQESQLIAGEN